MNLSFIVDTLRPILSRIEAEIVKKLLPHEPGVANTLAVQFDLSERQRGDTAAQVSLIACGRQWGVLSANDGRRISRASCGWCGRRCTYGAKLITDAQQLVAKKDVTAEERTKAHAMLADVDLLEQDIAIEERAATLATEQRSSARPPRAHRG